MKLINAFAILNDLRFAIQAAFLPTLTILIASPMMIFSPTAVSRAFMANVWVLFGDGVDANGRAEKEKLLTGDDGPWGVVLELGAGHGHTAHYLDRTKVTKYVALEPNERMHAAIRTHANASGFTETDGTLLILGCGAEDTNSILSSLSTSNSSFEATKGNAPQVDTLVSILTFCTIPNPQRTLVSLVAAVLKSGGNFLFYEHVLSDRRDVAWWQRFWTPIWGKAFDGCRLDRPTHLMVEGLGIRGKGGEGIWREGRLWGKDGEEVENLFWHQAGRFVKA